MLALCFRAGESMHDLLQSLDLPNLSEQAIHFGLRLTAALILLLIGLWLIARIANLFRRALERGHLDSTLTGFLRNVVYGILIALLLVAALQFAGLPSASLITALGAAAWRSAWRCKVRYRTSPGACC